MWFVAWMVERVAASGRRDDLQRARQAVARRTAFQLQFGLRRAGALPYSRTAILSSIIYDHLVTTLKPPLL
jgi:hypothetical protein